MSLPGASPSPPVPAHIAAIDRPVQQLMTWYVIRAILATVAFPAILPYLYFRYHTMRYRFDDEGIRMSWGILFRREILLNYSRIQDIHIESNFVERMLGLARIEIQTAAGASGAHMTLEGLPDHQAMRDFLYSRMRGANSHNLSGPPVPPASDNELAHLLRETAGELHAIRQILADRRRAD